MLNEIERLQKENELLNETLESTMELLKTIKFGLEFCIEDGEIDSKNESLTLLLNCLSDSLIVMSVLDRAKKRRSNMKKS